MLEYIKTDNWWNLIISLHEVHYGSFASIRSSSKEKWLRDCSRWNSTLSSTQKSKRTLQDFQRSFTRPQTVNGVGVTIFELWPSVLKTEILGRLQRQLENAIWGCLGGILPLSWIPKSWKTLPAFHWLLIQSDPSNGLDVTEFCASATLLELFETEQQLDETKFRKLS
jgi:hypothetical protein